MKNFLFSYTYYIGCYLQEFIFKMKNFKFIYIVREEESGHQRCPLSSVYSHYLSVILSLYLSLIPLLCISPYPLLLPLLPLFLLFYLHYLFIPLSHLVPLSSVLAFLLPVPLLSLATSLYSQAYSLNQLLHQLYHSLSHLYHLL